MLLVNRLFECRVTTAGTLLARSECGLQSLQARVAVFLSFFFPGQPQAIVNSLSVERPAVVCLLACRADESGPVARRPSSRRRTTITTYRCVRLDGIVRAGMFVCFVRLPTASRRRVVHDVCVYKEVRVRGRREWTLYAVTVESRTSGLSLLTLGLLAPHSSKPSTP